MNIQVMASRVPFRIHLLVTLLVLLLSTILIISLTKADYNNLAHLEISDVKSVSIGNFPAFSEDTEWHPAELPEDNYRQLSGISNRFYRITIPDNTSETVLTLLITYVSRPVEILYNNSQIKLATARPIKNTYSGRKFRRATCLPIDYSQLKPNKEITINITPDINDSALIGQLYIGETQSLSSYCKRDSFIAGTLVQLIIFTMVLSALFVSLLWVLRPKESVYLFYGLAVMLWSVYSYGHIPLNLPVAVRTWDWIHLAALMYWPVAVIIFCNRFTGRREPAVEMGFVVYAAIVCMLALVLSERYFYYFADSWWPLLSYVSGFYASWVMLRAVFSARTASITWMTVCGMLIMILSAHDIAVLAHWMPPQHGLLLHYSAALLVVVFTSILLHRFVEALHFAEELNRELAGTVQAKSSEIRNHLATLRKLERQQALTNERNRIMRELHDGIGGDILSMRVAIEEDQWGKNEISSELANVQDELYLLIHSLDQENSTLAMALGKLRYRLEQRVELAGIRFHYSVADLPDMETMPHAQIVDVMRIVQEAVTNAVKHANASNISVTICSQKHKNQCFVHLSVSDDGSGLTQGAHRGYGIDNMCSRADQLGGQISFNALNPGTKVLLELPAINTTYNTSSMRPGSLDRPDK